MVKKFAQGTLNSRSLGKKKGHGLPCPFKKSVTIFTKVPGKDINPSFGDITVGHNFKSGAAEIWDFAYCYVNIIDDAESIRIDLSLRSSYDINSRPTL